MSVNRREVRESVFILSFEKMFREDSTDDIIELAEELGDLTINDEVIHNFKGIVDKADELDEVIQKFSNKRTIDRIPKINLALLRLAIYEARYDEKVPINVAISEAVALAGKYAQEADIAFINGVLGAYSRSDEAQSV
ncbi:transcription antitermination factor NusB [Ruminococcus sp. NK3A76]|uniref:transcription antitermination factor NusB n=1 Tax=Ruminococcus sp. NK3A76 TaxID=877411 RepID=UPI000568F25B|nr:transcription antitermination factor NusB [Ruminococcus sp. NK3A76]